MSHQPTVSLRMLASALCCALLTLLTIAMVVATGCATPPEVPEVAADALDDAVAHLDEVGSVLEQGALTLDSAAKTLDALRKFRSAYDSERYSEALSHLEKALAEAEAAGFKTPPDIVLRLGQTKLLLQLAGK